MRRSLRRRRAPVGRPAKGRPEREEARHRDAVEDSPDDREVTERDVEAEKDGGREQAAEKGARKSRLHEACIGAAQPLETGLDSG